MAKISAKEVVQDIRSGMDDTRLMAKYQLSPQGLRVLFRKLLDMKAITQAELANRTPASDKTMVMAFKCPACGKPQPKQVAECPDCGIIVSKFLERQVRSQKQEPDSRSKPEPPKTIEGTPGFFRRLELVNGSNIYIAAGVAGILLISVLACWFVVGEFHGRKGDTKPVKEEKTTSTKDSYKAEEMTPAVMSFYFREAVEKGDVHTVERLLRAGADVNAKSEGDWTALMQASDNGHVEVVKALLDKGADVNAKSGYTALILASQGGHLEVAKVLLAKGADVNAKVFLDKGVDSDLATKVLEGYTALILASQGGHLEVAKVLLAKGADVNAKAQLGYTALIWATSGGYGEVVRVLIDAGADINAKSQQGTALILASQGGHLDVAKVLLAKGADVNAKSEGGITALQMASDTKMADLLKAYGAKK